MLSQYKLAPAAIVLAGLLLVAVMAASVSAATRSAAARPTKVAPGPGQVVTFTAVDNRCGTTLGTTGNSPCLTKSGTTEFAPQAAKPLAQLPAPAAIKTALATALRAVKLGNRPLPPRRATGATP
jgi:hypothetical protein